MRKSLKTAVILMLVLILGMISLVGCSNEAAKQEALEKETAQQEPAAQEDSFEKIKAKGKVVMGLDDTFAPMGFRDENNKIVGFDVDLAQEVFKRNDLELVLQPIL